MKKLQTIRKCFIYILPVILFFSYYPLINLGESSELNLELSLSTIWLFLFSIISAPNVFLFIKNNINKEKIAIIVSTLFPFYSLISILWSANFMRAVLTTGMSWCIWISIISIIDFFKNNRDKDFKKQLISIFLISSIIVCIFCWLQCLLDVLGVNRETTLLCVGCTSYVFGFPHPNGFAIEPQFMGNLLLIPSFLSLFFLYKASTRKRKCRFLVCAVFIISTLFLTMSRGAIYAFFLGMAFWMLMEIVKTKKPKIFIFAPVIILSFGATLCCQGIFASVSPTNDTFLSGISKVINQLSLGTIDIPYELKETQNNDEANIEVIENENNTSEFASQFDGYVEISTTTRLGLSELALISWIKSPERFIFGVGIGAAGKAMNETDPCRVAEKEIVQNEVVEIALELGLIGVIILILNIVLIIKIINKNEQKNILFTILITFVVTYMFFSGLPNALHIFLLPPILYFVLSKKSNLLPS